MVLSFRLLNIIRIIHYINKNPKYPYAKFYDLLYVIDVRKFCPSLYLIFCYTRSELQQNS